MRIRYVFKTGEDWEADITPEQLAALEARFNQPEGERPEWLFFRSDDGERLTGGLRVSELAAFDVYATHDE